jgi:hypothetical protein
MTLTSRNNYLFTGIGVSLAVLAGAVILANQTLPLFLDLVKQAARRPSGYPLAGGFPVNPYVPFIVMLAAALYAVAVQTLIYQFFEKTQSPEIFFFSLFAFSFTLECGRLSLPLQHLYALPQAFTVAAERVKLFGRLFGIFSLFISSVYATGLKAQKQGTILFSIFIAAMLFAIRVPVDSLAWDTCLHLDSGYRSVLRMLELTTGLLAVASYLVSAHLKGSKEFVLIGTGALLVFIGRIFLFDADSLYTPVPALICLVTGTWFVCRQLHRLYLWM